MGDLFGGGGDDAAEASVEAAEIQAQYQKEALAYLKETEAVPQYYREAALEQMGGAVGIGEGPSQQEQIDRAKASPLYSAIMGGQEAGEEAILRQQSATGGLRSGDTQAALYDYNTQLSNQALLQSYNQQQQQTAALAGLPSMAPAIAQQTSSIGTTYAQGKIGAAQAQQTGSQQGIGNLFSAAGLGMQAYETFSDIRLKDNIKKIGKRNGHNWYSWTWNDKAEELGLKGKGEGVLADEIEKYIPEAVITHNTGYKIVDLSIIGV